MAANKLSARLRMKLRLLQPDLAEASRHVLDHPEPAEFYPQYIAAMHGISRAAVPLMKAAIRALEARHQSEQLTPPLRSYLEHHIPEETGHDRWALEDLEVIGIDRSSVLGLVPSTSIAAMVGAQYYWIEHVHPVGLMGYLAIMEANAPTPESVEKLIAATGYPPEAFRSMRLHAQLDIQHEEDLYQTLDTLPLDARQKSLLTTSALHTAELLTQSLVELVARSRSLLPVPVPVPEPEPEPERLESHVHAAH